MASLYPAQFLHASHLGKIAVGYQADMVLLDNNWQVSQNWIAGQQSYSNTPSCSSGT
jgi:N-acetylglucosamine-6-phosphate deacetylase